jgi:hypothetical protein
MSNMVLAASLVIVRVPPIGRGIEMVASAVAEPRT